MFDIPDSFQNGMYSKKNFNNIYYRLMQINK